MTPHDAMIWPAPTDDEAAAIISTIMAHLATTRPAAPASTPQPSAWSLAGRLASQGQSVTHTRGVRPTWATISRGSWVVSRES